MHLVKKYNKNIKRGLEIVIIWNDERYLLPDIYNYEANIINIDVYNNDGLIDYYFDYNLKTVKCSSKRLSSDYKSCKEGTRIGTYNLTVGYPINTHVNLSTEKYNTDAKRMGYITTQYINNNIDKVLKNISK